MNITKEIHLAHIKFTIDQDAYIILDAYLKKLENVFISNISKSEIIEDIEIRLAEIFNEKQNKDAFVISITEVNKAIEILGTPEVLAEEEEEDLEDLKLNKSNRKLYRDTEDSYISGVAGGLGHYFKVDSVWIRVLFILFFFLPVPFTTLVYLILWIVVPAAKTNADKIRMMGGKVNINSIKKKVNEDVSKVLNEIGDQYDKKIFKNNIRYFFEKLFLFVQKVFKYFLKFISVIISVILLFISFMSILWTIIFGTVAGFITSSTRNVDVPSWFISDENLTWADIIHQFDSIYNIIFGVIFIIIPMIYLFIFGIKLLTKKSQLISFRTSYIIIGLWLTSLIYFMSIIILNYLYIN